MENVLSHIDEVSGKSLKEKLRANQDKALLSKELATICLEAPVSRELADYAVKGMPKESREFLRMLEFKNMWEKFAAVLGTEGEQGTTAEDPLSLFGEPAAETAWEKLQ